MPDPSVLALVPARGGSKGVPRKNLRSIADRPLLSYAYDPARASRFDLHVVTSTDDDEIAAMAESLGSEVVRRPADLAGDETPMAPVVAHALTTAEASTGRRFDIVVLLQPPSPIRRGVDIDAVVSRLAADPGIDSVVSVCRVEDGHPARMYAMDPDDALVPLEPDHEFTRRQDLPLVYHRNGAIYAYRRDNVLAGEPMGRRTVGYEMPATWAANIDDERDLLIADVIVRWWLDHGFDQPPAAAAGS